MNNFKIRQAKMFVVLFLSFENLKLRKPLKHTQVIDVKISCGYPITGI